MTAADGAIKVLVIGSGFGCRIQTPALRAAGFDVVGLVGSDAGRTAERAASSHIPQSFVDLDEAIARTGAQAVTVATPPSTHADLAIAALQRGCHVLCEKPFARDTAEASRMLEAAERSGRVHMIGHEFRFVPQQALIRRAIAEGQIGEPRLLNSILSHSYVGAFADNLPDWWWRPELGGGWLGASGSHSIDQVRAQLGEFASLSASMTTVTGEAGGVEDSFTLRFALDSGLEGVILQSSRDMAPPLYVFRVVGSKGTLWAQDADVWVSQGGQARKLDMPSELVLPPPPPPSTDPRQASVEWQFLTAAELPPYARLCAAFRAAIEGGEAPGSIPAATFADGVACMRVMDAIRDSASRGGAAVTL